MKWWQPGFDFAKGFFDEKQRLDPHTYSGLLRSLIIGSLWAWVGWLFFDLTALNLETSNPREIQWYRSVLMVLLGFGYVVTLIAAISIFIQRRKLKKSTEGQWYDTQALTKRDLEYEAPEVEDGDKSEIKR